MPYHPITDKNPFGGGAPRKITLTKHDIEVAQESARSEMETARILQVNYKTYKKYAQMYGLFGKNKNPTGKGIPRIGKTSGPQIPLSEIVEGKHPQYDRHVLKKRLIRESYIEEKCDNCGFCERRITDYKVPLIMEFVNGVKHDYRLENIRLLCFNCYFLTVGNLSGVKTDYVY